MGPTPKSRKKSVVPYKTENITRLICMGQSIFFRDFDIGLIEKDVQFDGLKHPFKNTDATTETCKNHDFESCDENQYSSEEHILSDDEGNVIVIAAGINKKSVDDLADDWTDTESEAEGTNDKHYGGHNKDRSRNDNGNQGDLDNDNSKFDGENRINEDNGEENIQIYRGRHRRGSGHRGGRGRGGGGHGHHSGGHHSHHSGGHHVLHLTKVFMPTGKMVSIAVPEQLKRWKCGRPTKLINLDPHGRHGRHEFEMVSKVVQLTKREHPSGHFDHYRFIKIEKVVNGCFWKRYRARQKEIHAEAKFVNERMLFHGTNKVKDLLKSGFDERYANINGMFGAGIYFAKHSSKSNQYAFGLNNPCPTHNDKNCDICERQMILCRVTMGKTQKVTRATKIAHAPPGRHSLEGVASPGGLKYPEYIVYRGEQVYPEYLITYKIVK